MPLKPLEKPKKNYLPKIIFILILLLSGSLFFKQSFLKKNTLEDALGAETKLKEVKASVSLDNVKKQGEGLYSQLSSVVQNEAGSVLGLASDVASNSAETVKEYIFSTTVSSVIKQIEKLPESEQQIIKKQICQ